MSSKTNPKVLNRYLLKDFTHRYHVYSRDGVDPQADVGLAILVAGNIIREGLDNLAEVLRARPDEETASTKN